MEKAFVPAAVEPRWRARWEEIGLGVADPASSKPKFVIALPPPNITGRLHMGHACGFSIQDTLARHRRMLGFEVEWCPGTDHAAIATNAIIERQLASEGTSKEALGRIQFDERVAAWYAEYGGYILEQMRNLGYSCDWSRTRFTLDAPYVRAIRTVFKELYDQGLIYRGPRIVNWCPHDRSAISDEEVDWNEHTDTLTHLRYPVEGGGEIVVATVRPETMLGDAAVAVAPGDVRYAHLVGRTVILPLVGRRIPIVEDAAVRPEFGSGALKVTPAHDPTDYEIGERHGLEPIAVIADDGSMDVPDLPQFHGMPAEKARKAVTEALRELGVVASEEPYVHEVGHCDRCGHVLEPLVSAQWWVRMASLAEPGIDVAETGTIRFHPRRYTDVYLSWMRNIRDWCISRQIWLGHAIPVSTCGAGHRFAWVEPPEACPECGSHELTADPDVLDTWFSSALWPFAIFGWPDQTVDLDAFYPTDVLVTARDIIFLWVARMIMTGLKFPRKIPFSDVIITSTIQAADGSRMSKSKGNAVDPQDMIDRYGADAIRAWAVAVGTGGQDVRFDEERIRSYQHFANKLWNVTRLLVARLGGDAGRIPRASDSAPSGLLAEDRWMLARVRETVEACNRGIQAYRFQEAMDALYDTVWRTYCDWYVEMVKARLDPEAEAGSHEAAAWTLVTCLDIFLRLLHPFMPFVTEECAQHIDGAAATLQQRSWPQPPEDWNKAVPSIEPVLDLVQKVRTARQEAGSKPNWRERDVLVLETAGGPIGRSDTVRLLQALDAVAVADTGEGPSVSVVAGALHASLYLRSKSDAGDRARLEKQLNAAQARIQRLEDQLGNEQFTTRARPDVVARARQDLESERAQAETLSRLLAGEGAA